MVKVKPTTVRKAAQVLAVVLTLWLTYLLYANPMGVCWLEPFWHIQDIFASGGAALYLGLERVDLADPATTLTVLSPFIIIGLFAGFALLSGRLFCGWLCPYGSFLEAVDAVSPIKGREMPVELRDAGMKYVVLIGFIVIAFLAGYTTFCDFCPAGVLFKGAAGHVVYSAVPVFGLTTLLAAAYGRKTWCSYLCPVGGFLALFTRFHIMPIKTTSECIKCLNCERACPMDVLVAGDYAQKGRDITDPECIKCMRCVEVCPKKTLRFP